MRIFDNHLWSRQAKSMKKITCWIIKNQTTVLQHLYEQDSGTTAPKFRESCSNHLWNVNMQPVIDTKIKQLITQSKKYKERNILAWDASDIFKPHAKCMQWLSRVRDWSTWLSGNGYVFYGTNINGITAKMCIKNTEIAYIGSELREEVLIHAKNFIRSEETIAIFDRGHDDAWFLDILQEQGFEYIVRGKKSRIIYLLDQKKEVKVSTLDCGRYRVRIEGGIECYLYIVKGAWKDPVLLYSSLTFDTDEECLQLYLKRRTIEMDYKKMKGLWLEDVRLMKLEKITALLLLIQFIVIVWQSLYNDIVNNLKSIPYLLILHLKRFCANARLWINPSSILTFLSKNLWSFVSYNFANKPIMVFPDQ